MLVSFWSPTYREETAQILTLVGGMCCREFPCSIVCAENFLHIRNLGFHMLGSRYDSVRRGAKRGSDVYYRAGEIFIRHVCSEMGRSCRYGSVITADRNGLAFLPLDQSLYEDSYRFVVSEALEQQIDMLESRYDEIFLNLQANENDTTVTFLDRSEVVVVCLPASVEVFDDFYSRYRSILGKCFFVFFGKGGMPQALRARVRKYLAKHMTRCCHIEMTAMLRNYLSDGRALDYLDRFRGTLDNPPRAPAEVAEAEEEYRALTDSLREEMDEYTRWKNDTSRRISNDMLEAVSYRDRTNADAEKKTLRSLRYICCWLINHEFRDSDGDRMKIAERMLRRRIVPKEVMEWEMVKE